MKEKLLLLHGALGTSSQMQPFASGLAHTFDVLTMDFAGHGRGADLSRGLSMQNMSDEIAAFIAGHHVQPIHVFGYSMGGYAAVNAALHHPELFRSVTTLGTMFHWSEEIAWRETKFLHPETILQKVPAFAQKLEQLHGENWRLLLSCTAEMMLSLGRNPLFSADDLKASDTKFTCMIGDSDQTADPLITEKFAQSSGADFFLIANTPHAIEKADHQKIMEMLLHHVYSD